MTKTILVVDDDSLCRTLVSTALMRLGYNVLCAENGAGAWKLCLSRRVSLVVSDVDMPLMGGLELLSNLRSAKPQLPVVMMSSSSAGDSIDWKNLGAVAFFAKPFSFEKISEIVSLIS